MNQLQSAWEKSFTDKRYRIALHVVFWFVYMFLLLVVGYYLNEQMNPGWQFDYMDILGILAANLILMGATYYLSIFLSYQSFLSKESISGDCSIWLFASLFISSYFIL